MLANQLELGVVSVGIGRGCFCWRVLNINEFDHDDDVDGDDGTSGMIKK